MLYIRKVLSACICWIVSCYLLSCTEDSFLFFFLTKVVECREDSLVVTCYRAPRIALDAPAEYCILYRVDLDLDTIPNVQKNPVSVVK